MARRQKSGSNTYRQDYDTSLLTGALLWHETKLVAVELVNGKTMKQIGDLVVSENLFLRSTAKTSSNIFSFIKRRLIACPEPLIRLISSSDMELSKQATFVAIVNSSRFVCEFLDEVVSEKLMSFSPFLESNYWERFWQSCVSKDPSLSSTRLKSIESIKQVIKKILFEVGTVEQLRSFELKKVRLHPELSQFLKLHNDKELIYALRALI